MASDWRNTVYTTSQENGPQPVCYLDQMPIHYGQEHIKNGQLE